MCIIGYLNRRKKSDQEVPNEVLLETLSQIDRKLATRDRDMAALVDQVRSLDARKRDTEKVNAEEDIVDAKSLTVKRTNAGVTIGGDAEAIKAYGEMQIAWGQSLLAKMEPQPAIDVFREALKIMEHFNDRRGVVSALHGLGVALWGSGDLQSSVSTLEAAIDEARRAGYQSQEDEVRRSLQSVRDTAKNTDQSPEAWQPREPA